MVSRLGDIPAGRIGTLPARPGLPTTPTGPTVTTPLPPGPVRPGTTQPTGWTPAPPRGWMAPAYDIWIPDNLGRPPRTADVTIRKGFDGRTPDEVVKLVKGKLTNALDARNVALVERHIRENHKSFTIAVSNMFINGSPPNLFAKNLTLDGSRVKVHMTMSAFSPVLMSAQRPNETEPRWFGKGPNGEWTSIPTPKYAPVAESQLRFVPGPALTMTYPKWSLPALAGKITEIVEL